VVELVDGLAASHDHARLRPVVGPGGYHHRRHLARGEPDSRRQHLDAPGHRSRTVLVGSKRTVSGGEGSNYQSVSSCQAA
jgi:hypothetical protein